MSNDNPAAPDSPTPRTDAVALANGATLSLESIPEYIDALVNLARQLERDLAAAQWETAEKCMKLMCGWCNKQEGCKFLAVRGKHESQWWHEVDGERWHCTASRIRAYIATTEER